MQENPDPEGAISDGKCVPLQIYVKGNWKCIHLAISLHVHSRVGDAGVTLPGMLSLCEGLL